MLLHQHALAIVHWAMESAVTMCCGNLLYTVTEYLHLLFPGPLSGGWCSPGKEGKLTAPFQRLGMYQLLRALSAFVKPTGAGSSAASEGALGLVNDTSLFLMDCAKGESEWETGRGKERDRERGRARGRGGVEERKRSESVTASPLRQCLGNRWPLCTRTEKKKLCHCTAVPLCHCVTVVAGNEEVFQGILAALSEWMARSGTQLPGESVVPFFLPLLKHKEAPKRAAALRCLRSSFRNLEMRNKVPGRKARLCLRILFWLDATCRVQEVTLES